jgi:hypothetical protein
MTNPKTSDPILKTANQALHLALLGLFAVTASASAQETVFGTDNDGYGGFTAHVAVTDPATVPGWAELADAVQFGNDGTSNTGFVNSNLLKEYNLSRTDGSSATITGVIDIVSTYAADNNRFGISLFATSDGIAGADTGLSLQHNLGNGQFRILAAGVNGSILNVNANYLGLNLADAIGTTFTYRADIAFVGTNIEIDFTLTDQNDFSQTLSITVAAADYPGTYFGFGTRGRVRNNNPGVNDIPFIYDAKTFSVVDVPPPVSGPPVLVITPNTTTSGNYDFTWTSRAGKEYDLVSSTELSTSISTWPVWDGRLSLPATPPKNTLADVPGGGDTRRFFAVVERNAPALFSENFDTAAALPAGWSSNGPVNGTDWQVGVPSGVPTGPVTAFTVPNCAGTNIGGYFTENTNVSLVTPVIAIPADTGATLLFRQLIDTDDDNGDIGSVRVLDADNADAPIAGLEITGLKGFGSEGDGWTENSLLMPALNVGGKNIKIEFNFVSDAGTAQDIDVFGGFYVDDVSVSLN